LFRPSTFIQRDRSFSWLRRLKPVAAIDNLTYSLCPWSPV